MHLGSRKKCEHNFEATRKCETVNQTVENHKQKVVMKSKMLKSTCQKPKWNCFYKRPISENAGRECLSKIQQAKLDLYGNTAIECCNIFFALSSYSMRKGLPA